MKSKSAVLPIVIVLIIGVVAAILIYVVSENAKTTTISGDELTVENLSDYEEKIKSYLGIETDDISLLYDSTVSVNGGKVEDMMLKIALNYSGDTEYWKVEEHSDGIQVTYVEKVNGATVCYTLCDLAAYLKEVDGNIPADNYTATFCTQITQAEYTADAVSYLWNGDSFERIYGTSGADCYAINVTDANGTQYVFYTA